MAMSRKVCTPWLRVVGIGDRGLDGLSKQARELISTAEIVIGGKRHLSLMPKTAQEHIVWPSPISILLNKLAEFRGTKTCVLATGDPMCYGIGASLCKAFPIQEMIILPSPSALSLACARMGWPHQDVELVTLHGRPLAILRSYLQPLAKIVVLSNDENSPREVAELLTEQGFGNSQITVLEHMGGSSERRIEGIARSWNEKPGAGFNTIAIEILSSPETVLVTRHPGLEDDLFINDGMLTKKEVRAITLSALQPYPGGLLWDVGAGSGSVGIEWMRLSPRSLAIAIEEDVDRAATIVKNANQLGTPKLQVINAHAPECLLSLPRPNAIFIGGGIATKGLFDKCWESLHEGGCLVTNVVTIEGEEILTRKQAQLGGSVTKITISKSEPLGKYRGWRSQMPVTQLRLFKNLGERNQINES